MKHQFLRIIIATTLLVVFASGESFSQLFVTAGPNISNMRIELLGEKVDYTKLKLGGQIGVNYNLSLIKRFSINPGISLVSKGTRFNSDTRGGGFNIIYLQAPVLFKSAIH